MPKQTKRQRIAFPCRVCACECTMEQESIQCDSCACWLHQVCIAMSMEQYVKFSQPHLQFFCHKCSFNVEGYNYLSALSRIYNCVPDLQRMHAKAESEQNLLQFYNVTLPVVQHLRDTVVPVHTESVLMLRDHAPWLLDSFQPADVGGDGNCLYRAVSFALYGHEKAYAHLRLLAAIECLLYRDLYDPDSAVYYAPYKADERLILTPYSVYVHALVENKSFSDMHSVLILSSVVQKPIQTRWPVVLSDMWDSPLTKRVLGRDVQTDGDINILWSVGGVYHTGDKLTTRQLNHFVPLIPVSFADNDDMFQEPAQEATAAVDNSEQSFVDMACIVPDGHRLNGRFMPLADCLRHLQDDDEDSLRSVPNGIKENAWFKVRPTF